MIVSLEWLKDYTDVNVTPEEFCDRMIMSGSNLETMEHVGCDMENVVVGKIVKDRKASGRRQAGHMPGGYRKGRTGTDSDRSSQCVRGSLCACGP